MIETLYEAYYKELTGWCRAMTKSLSLSEELVQEAFMRALLNRELLEGLREEQCRAWLYRTVKNLYVDYTRRNRRESVVETIPEQGTGAQEISELEWQELLASLPDEEGLLFTMRYLQGYNSKQLGEFFDMPPGTVRSKLSSARKHLRDAIGGNKYV